MANHIIRHTGTIYRYMECAPFGRNIHIGHKEEQSERFLSCPRSVAFRIQIPVRQMQTGHTGIHRQRFR